MKNFELITTDKVYRYNYNDFIITILEAPDNFESWLVHKDCGVASLMFGAPKKQSAAPQETTLPDFLELVGANIEDYIHGYLEEFMPECLED